MVVGNSMAIWELFCLVSEQIYSHVQEKGILALVHPGGHEWDGGALMTCILPFAAVDTCMTAHKGGIKMSKIQLSGSRIPWCNVSLVWSILHRAQFIFLCSAEEEGEYEEQVKEWTHTIVRLVPLSDFVWCFSRWYPKFYMVPSSVMYDTCELCSVGFGTMESVEEAIQFPTTSLTPCTGLTPTK
jgi:hypothetical protein